MRQRIWFLTLLGAALLLATPLATAQNASANTVCGVDLGTDSRCFQELKKLQEGCEKKPVICGHSLKRRGLVSSKVLRRRCTRMWRRRDPKWVRSLCGVALYSRPRTFCGKKGIEVALACSKQALQKAGVSLQPAPRRRVSAPAPARPAVAAVRPTPRPGTTRPAPPRARPAVATTAPPANASGANTTVSWGGPIVWLFLLQFITLGFVFFLFRSQQERKPRFAGMEDDLDWNSNPTWSPDSSWGNFNSQYGTMSPNQSSLSEEFEDVLDPKMKKWGQRLETHLETLRKSPMDDLQAQGNAIHEYYVQLAQTIMEQVVPGSSSQIQGQLLKAQERLDWMFSAHREPNGPVALVADLRDSLDSTLQGMLNEMGHLNVHDVIEQRINNGSFSFQEFVARKQQDQALAFLNDKPLPSFGEICREYLQRLDTLYQSNLRDIRSLLSTPSSISAAEQQKMFQEQYIHGFLMRDLPQKLDALSRQSSPNHVGALLDRLATFVEESLTAEGLELYPRPSDDELESHVHNRIRFVRYAGVRGVEEQDKVLRAPRFPSTPPGEVPSAISEQELVSVGAAEREQPAISESKIQAARRAASMVGSRTLPHGLSEEEEVNSYPNIDAANDFRSSPPRPSGSSEAYTREYGKNGEPKDS